MEKSEQPKASKREDAVDFISNMPDGILLLILSRLSSTEEVIRSSILSKRWRHLWTAIPCVELDIRFGGKLYTREFKKSVFKEFAYWVLVNRSVDLDRFSLFCSFYYSMSTVGRWIHAAVARNVKRLDLSFCPKEETEYIELPHCLVTCGSLEELKLDLSYRGLNLPKVTGFPALRVLVLVYVELSGDSDLVKGFLESCPLLEDLTLLGCSLRKLDLCISCPKLKKLRIFNVENIYDGPSGGIKITCPKLVDLDLTGFIANNFFFECLNSLNKAEIEPELMGNIKYVLFPGISHVEHLLIGVYLFSQCIKAARDPSLPNLKTLVLTTTIDDFSIHKLNQILKHYPKLESLNLIIKKELDGLEEWELHEGDARRMLSSSDVKMMEFFEFNGEKPKVVINWHEMTFMQMVFSWGTKAKYFQYIL